MVLTVERHVGGVALVTFSPEAAKNTFTSSNFDSELQEKIIKQATR